MLTADFDYELPEERIAQYAVARGKSRLLTLAADGAIGHHRIAELPELLSAGDLLVVNDTRVVPCRLFARRPDGAGRVELFLVERLDERQWHCLARPGRRARPGARLVVEGGPAVEVVARESDSGQLRIRFAESIEPHLERIGHVPLPPYIHRADEPADRERYQTVYAREPGAIAAPTAGLHFDEALLARLRAAGIEIAEVTLHVGIGTFKPVRSDLVHEHRMDAERYRIGAATASAIAAARAAGGRIVAVGTTVVRALETVAGENEGEIVAGAGATELFITPGFRFRAVDRLLTNFHLPRSTLLMLVAAFAGRQRVLGAYAEAVERGYRFYSYGDAMLAERSPD